MLKSLFDVLPKSIVNDFEDNLKIITIVEKQLNFFKEDNFSRYDKLDDNTYMLVLNDIKLTYLELANNGFDFRKFGTYLETLNTNDCIYYQELKYNIYIENETSIHEQLLKMFSIHLHNQNENNYIKYSLQVNSFFSTLPNFMYRYVFFKEFMWTLPGKE